jgi:hypothetical protein
MAMEKHTVRHHDGGEIEVLQYSPRKAIKLMCSECLGWESEPGKTMEQTVQDCTAKLCPLYPHRGAYRPKRMTDEEKEVNAKRLQAAKSHTL